jgi:hypothetical protein
VLFGVTMALFFVALLAAPALALITGIRKH